MLFLAGWKAKIMMLYSILTTQFWFSSATHLSSFLTPSQSKLFAIRPPVKVGISNLQKIIGTFCVAEGNLDSLSSILAKIAEPSFDS